MSETEPFATASEVPPPCSTAPHEGGGTAASELPVSKPRSGFARQKLKVKALERRVHELEDSYDGLFADFEKLERDYIKQRLSVYHAAVEALVGPAPWTETKDHLVSLTEHSGNRQAAGRLVTRCCRASPRHPSEPAFSGRAVRSVAASFL